MASVSSAHVNDSGAFDFASDEVLCSYEGYSNQGGSDGIHADNVIGANSAKEFHKNRMAKSSMFPVSSYSPPVESSNQDVISTIENTMKKCADDLMRFLEGISLRLSQLELYCYNLDKSIRDMRSDIVQDHGKADSKLKSLEKHLQEVVRSVQILRDKQEFADTQKELAKLQLVQRESSPAVHSQQNERAASPASDYKRTDNSSDMNVHQLALALPHQVAPQHSHPARSVEQQHICIASSTPMAASKVLTQPQPHYLLSAQISNGQYLASNTQPQVHQMMDISRVVPQPAQAQVNQSPHVSTLPQYQKQWPQQLPSQVQLTQQTAMQSQRPPSASVFPSYLSSPPASASLPETVPNSMQMQVPFPALSQLTSSHAEAIPYGYGGRPVQQQPSSPHLKATFGTQPGDTYAAVVSHPTITQRNAYMMYDSEGVRPNHPPQQPQFEQSVYSPAGVTLQNPQPSSSGNLLVRPQFTHNHPCNELIEKLMSMGYRADHVVSIIQRLEESGQLVDFNAVFDMINGHSSGGSRRGWSG